MFTRLSKRFSIFKLITIFTLTVPSMLFSNENNSGYLSNFGLPGIVDLPSGYSLPDGEFIIMQTWSDTLARTGLSAQVLPRVGFSFRYSGQGEKSPPVSYTHLRAHET